MKDLYSIKPKKRKRLILLLSAFFALLLITEFIEKRSLKSIDQDFSSLYQDRLLPASQMYELSGLLHEKRMLFEDIKDNGEYNASFNLKEIKAYNSQIDQVLLDYGQTYLVEREEVYFEDFKKHYKEYLVLENTILENLKEEDFSTAIYLINKNANDYFKILNLDLHNIASIQPEVGEQLMAHYKSSSGITSLLYYFKIALTILIGIFVLRLLGLEQLLRQPKQRFELN
ncbi:MCP four helix bundle domain-containing protein [Salegentibacter salegens]|uniref:Four helix bundle sensory module for signal transduction n=1 Tax=Salegentibacter salegens TaxID=143223 RepID=A0A1M7NJ42_9FLAO|nr:MCP four helix bundle domain-containing protein [Salegentibacter salegens]PRX43362.1 chemoreceptor-like protein with four helix bundle sensory module [Salegentibacter salegens]SHN03812.1 Four helix bundle sensory module for signal transduction [Salegentibacter salegens]